MSGFEDTLYGLPEWRSDPHAALDEAERRIARVLEDPSLTALCLSDLGALPQIPDSLARCTSLVRLDAGSSLAPNGRFYGLGDKLDPGSWGILSSLTQLEEANCGGLGWIDLSPIAGLTRLKKLDIAINPIRDCTGLSELKSLESLDISFAQIDDLSPLAQLSHLKKLDISNSAVSELSSLSTLSNLIDLDLSQTRITDLSAISACIHIERLAMIGSKVKSLGPLSAFSNLKLLNCSTTPVADLGPLAELYCLREIDCSMTQVRDLSPLQKLGELRDIICYGTPIDTLDPLSGLSKLQSLSASNTEIADLQPLSGCAVLRTLDVSRTQVENLDQLNALEHLEFLFCAGLPIADLGPISNLRNLDTLSLHETQVKSLAPLASLRNLKSLICSSTQVDDLSVVSGFQKLEMLDCSDTPVNDISPLFGTETVKIVFLSGTNLHDISGLSQCPNLEQVQINGCALSRLPVDLIWAEKINSIVAHQAILPGVPEEILSQSEIDDCLFDLRAHLQDLGDDPVPLREVKLSVLGNGRIGKTQICNRLRGEAFQATAESTHGIDVTTARLPDADYAFNVWDFGGQDIYHGTHALFLRSRAVFLLVWTPDTDNHDESVDPQSGMVFRNQKMAWWLDYVRRYGSGTSPLIVIQNQIDLTEEQGEHSAVNAFRAERPGIFCKSMAYSARDRTGHPTLLDNLGQALERFNPPLMGRSRMRIKEHLRHLRVEDEKRPAHERQHRRLTMSEFEAICSEQGPISAPRLFLQFLHNAGDVFWRDGVFEDNIILDQAWVLEAVYTVFNRKNCVAELGASHGRFSAATLDSLVWHDLGYSDTDQHLFITFMVACGICFAIEDGGAVHYIAPDYLPKTTPERSLFDFDGEASQQLDFDSLPPLLIRDVISFIGRAAGAHAHYWRDGVVFFDTNNQSRVLIEQSATPSWRGHITVTVRNGNFLNALTATVELIVAQAHRFGVTPQQHTVTSREFEEMKPGPDPGKPMSYYVSYAWDDAKTSETESLTRIVDQLCAAAEQRGIHIQRDKDNIRLGGLISEFMGRLAQGDRIVVILSNRYLQSRACMTELHRIWMRVGAEGDAFRNRVRVFAHPGTKIWTPVDRARVAQHWADVYDQEKSFLEHMGSSDRAAHHIVKQFAAHVGDILAVVADTLQPRSLDQLVAHSFD